MTFRSLAALAALVAGLQLPAPPGIIAVVVDSEALVTDAAAAARLREQALTRLDPDGRAVYFNLTAKALDRIPDSARDSFRRTPFVTRPPVYSGVSLGFAEAVEILRKNEAVRDAVIRRECSASPARGCAGGVHAAAMALVADTEAATARKLRHLGEAAMLTRASTLIVMTAGWPFRDERSLGIERVARDLQASGTRVVVVRQSGAVEYQGLVRDASELIAVRLSGGFTTLSDERDLAALPAADKATPARPSSDVAAPRNDASPARGPADDLLRSAARYVGRFEQAFSAMVWRERYEQEDRVRRRFPSSGASFSTIVARRRLDSELLFVWLPQDSSWIAVRDVAAIDGRPRPAGERRLQALLGSRDVSVGELRQLAAENGRFNIGRILRTFNEPTLALLFLDDHYRPRFSFTRTGEQMLGKVRAVMYEFVERARPTVIQEKDRDVPARGTLWIEKTTGRVLRTVLELSDPAAGLRGTMTVSYAANPKFDVLLPVEMRESYTAASGEEVTTVARYSDFRRFETGGRLILRK